MADVAADLKTWSTTAASNSPADATTVGSGLADNLQEIQKVVRQDLAHKGADIASSGTTDLGAVAGFMHDITGTTTITSFGTVSAGIHKRLQFDGALTITHNATSLICPGGVSIATWAGLCLDLVSLGSGNWIITSQLPSMVLLETKTASVSSSLDFTAFNASFEQYMFVLQKLSPATNAVDLHMRHSVDGGFSYLAGTNYSYVRNTTTSSAPTTLGGTGSLGAAEIQIAPQLSNSDFLSGRLWMGSPTASDATWNAGYVSSGGLHVNAWGSGRCLSGSTTNALRFILSSGNIDVGTIRMYGMRK